jgi:quercetin dioxygenase-like cupin family protein
MRSRFAIAALIALALPAVAIAQAPTITWGPAPAVLPPGAKLAVLKGDPGQSGLYTMRLDLPDGYRVAPHTHPTDEHLTIISGTFLLGMGDSFEAAGATVLPAGGFATVHANMHHYAITRGRTVVQIHGMGPFVLTYVDSKNDPRGTVSAR